MSDEIIVVDDSSVEEEPYTNVSGNRRAKERQAPPQVENVSVELLDDDDDDDHDDNDDDDNDKKRPANELSFEQQMKMAKRQSLDSLLQQKRKGSSRGNNTMRVSLSQSPFTNKNRRFATLNDDDSDSDDSLLQFQAFSAKRSQTTGNATDTTTPRKTLANEKNNTGSNNATATLSSSAKKSTPIVNPYAKAATRAPNSATTTTPSSTEPFQRIANPYSYSGKKKKAPSFGTDTANNNNNNNNKPATLRPAVQDFPYPTLLTTSIQYADQRAPLMLALWKCARSLTHHSFHKPKLDQTVKAIVDLALLPFPIRSVDEYCQRIKCRSASFNDHKSQVAELTEQLQKYGPSNHPAPFESSNQGKYCSIAEACLVAMADEIDRRQGLQHHGTTTSSHAFSLQEQLASKDMRISLEFLIPEIEKRLLFPFCPGHMQRQKDPDGGEAYYLDPSTRSAEYLQIKKLASGCDGYIVERSQKKKTVFEMTPKGYQAAKFIQSRIFPAPKGHYRTSYTESLDNVDPKFKGICLGMDFREGGLQKQVIHRMCNTLDMTKVPYFVGALEVGDYAFFCVQPGSPHHGKMLPLLLERKSIQDVAQSIADGRWISQKQRMYKGQHVFGYDNCRIAYIIEGKEEKEQVTGGFIAHRKFNVDLKTLKEAIDNLEEEGFEVLRSTNPENSMFQLSRWAEREAKEVNNGKLTIKYTYQEFKEAVRKIPKEVDFSRLARYHKKEREDKEKAEVEAAQGAQDNSTIGPAVEHTSKPNDNQRASLKEETHENLVDLCSDDDDDDGRVGVSAAIQNVVRSSAIQNHSQRETTTSKSKTILKDASASVANAVWSTSRFKASAEVRAYFNDGDKDDSAFDSDDSDDELANVRKLVARHQKQKMKKHKKRKENAQPKAKKQKRATQTTGAAARISLENDTKIKPEAASLEASSGDPAGEYADWSVSELREKCESYGLPKGGKKEELMERLKGPKPPNVWLRRKKDRAYVPARHDTGAAALLAALYLYERDEAGTGSNPNGMTKEELYAKAEGIEVTKNPFSGGTTQTGPFHYDGWSSMSELLKGALVVKKKERFKLTRGHELCGFELAKAVHKWSHEHNKCQCGTEP